MNGWRWIDEWQGKEAENGRFMTLLEHPSHCELELGLLTVTGPQHTLAWQG